MLWRPRLRSDAASPDHDHLILARRRARAVDDARVGENDNRRVDLDEIRARIRIRRLCRDRNRAGNPHPHTTYTTHTTYYTTYTTHTTTTYTAYTAYTAFTACPRHRAASAYNLHAMCEPRVSECDG